MTDSETPAPSRRLASIDAYRGLVMIFMMAEVLHLGAVARALPESGFWNALAYHQEHVAWIGCSVHDLIQPSFTFLVGVSLPFSIASRRARGQSIGRMLGHASWRALLLVGLGIFLRSMNHSQTYYTFEDTLTQIGLGYVFLFVLGLRPRRDQWIALGVILVGIWAAFALYPAPGSDFDFTRVGVPTDWPHLMSGFEAHWNKNSNLAWAFDRWFLNLFPREEPFLSNGGGYATLSFIPTLATMVLGLLAGGVLHDDRPSNRKMLWLIVAGVVTLGAGYGLGRAGLCPVVKRIWTPTWVLFSGGWCFLILATFYQVLDLFGLRRWAFPLVVVGMNSIAAYVMSWLVEGFLSDSLDIHLGTAPFRVLGEPYEPLLHGAAVLLLLWLILYWMYRKGVFLKI